MNKKILSTESLIKVIRNLKSNKKIIVQCHGVFDLIHIGHIKHFETAKKSGDVLVVSVTSDKYVNKGPDRPVFKEEHRAEFISSINTVDYVYINRSEIAIPAIKLIKPSFFFKGSDYKSSKQDFTKKIILESREVKKHKGKVIFSSDFTSSSSKLINIYSDKFSDTQKQFLLKLSKKYSVNLIKDYVSRFKKIKIGLIGETIIDQYVFGEIIGKSGKEPHLVMRHEKKNNYLGGVCAIANNLSVFSDSVSLVSILGNNKSENSFINKGLSKNIKKHFVTNPSSANIVKIRFIDSVSHKKMLGLYQIDDKIISKKEEIKIIAILKKILKKTQLLIISDYGHGLFTEKIAKVLMNSKKIAFLNAQVNASNHGYHSLLKYQNVNFVIINENELRHEMRNKSDSIECLAKKIIVKRNINSIVVTRGNSGSFMLRNNGKITYCPAFASKVVDKVGAGDAMLALIALCQKNNLADDLTLFISSVGSAISVENFANNYKLESSSFLRRIESMLK